MTNYAQTLFTLIGNCQSWLQGTGPYPPRSCVPLIRGPLDAFISPHYSSLARINLIKLVSCKTMIVSEERSPVVDSTLEEYQMRLLQVPRLGALRDETHPDYPFSKNLEDTWHETVGRITYLWHHWLSQAKCSDSCLGNKFWEATPVDPAY